MNGHASKRNRFTLSFVASLAACMVFALIAGCPGTNPPDGDGDGDGDGNGDMTDPCENVTCGEDEVCIDGTCVAATECTSNADCPAGQACTDGTCESTAQARNFVGANTCMPCHSEMHATWSETLHAGAWETLVEAGVQDQCIRCHVVGYEVGGFVDEETTPEFAGVQCENCHGAAGDHASNPGDLSLRPTVSVSAKVCGQCHTGSHHPNFDQWQQSGHAMVNEHVEESLLAGGSSVNSCGVCHSGDVHFEAVILGEEVAEDRFAGVSGEDLNAVTCAICHDPHAQTGNAVAPGDGRDFQLRYPQVADPVPANTVEMVTDNQRFNVCGQCHHSRGRTWDATSRGPHHSVQSNVYFGEMPTPDGTESLVANTGSVHSIVPEQCATCHMYRKDFESEEAPAISGHLFSVNFNACMPCHTPEDAESMVSAIGSEVQSGLDSIVARLGDPATWQYAAEGGPPEADAAEAGQMSQDDISDAIKQVRFLKAYVENDGSLGVHNPAYVRAILEEADSLLTGDGL